MLECYIVTFAEGKHCDVAGVPLHLIPGVRGVTQTRKTRTDQSVFAYELSPRYSPDGARRTHLSNGCLVLRSRVLSRKEGFIKELQQLLRERTHNRSSEAEARSNPTSLVIQAVCLRVQPVQRREEEADRAKSQAGRGRTSDGSGE